MTFSLTVRLRSRDVLELPSRVTGRIPILPNRPSTQPSREGTWEDYLYWQGNDGDVLRRINGLLQDIGGSPARGIGKSEPLRGDLGGWWSRRITGDHRLVYRIRGSGEEPRVEIVACRNHYSSRR